MIALRRSLHMSGLDHMTANCTDEQTIRDAIGSTIQLQTDVPRADEAFAALGRLVAERKEWKSRRDELYDWQTTAVEELLKRSGENEALVKEIRAAEKKAEAMQKRLEWNLANLGDGAVLAEEVWKKRVAELKEILQQIQITLKRVNREIMLSPDADAPELSFSVAQDLWYAESSIIKILGEN